jgi:hypothetical protein
LCGKPRKEIIGYLFRCAIDQPLPDLRQLSADDSPGCVVQNRTAAMPGNEHDFRFAAAETGGASARFALEEAASGRIEFALLDDGPECCFQRPDPEGRHRIEMACVAACHLLASGNAGLQDRRIVERRPHGFRRRRYFVAPGEIHPSVPAITMGHKALQAFARSQGKIRPTIRVALPPS